VAEPTIRHCSRYLKAERSSGRSAFFLRPLMKRRMNKGPKIAGGAREKKALHSQSRA
jgi:hypothetical protein